MIKQLIQSKLYELPNEELIQSKLFVFFDTQRGIDKKANVLTKIFNKWTFIEFGRTIQDIKLPVWDSCELAINWALRNTPQNFIEVYIFDSYLEFIYFLNRKP